jgi:glycosyltransferase involved in cell wall biosynthesis
MPARLSILHLLNPEEYGGLESVVALLAAGQHRRGHEVRVAPTLPREDASARLVTCLRDAGVEVIPLVVPGRGYLRERRLAAELCRRYRPSVVHTHNFRSDVLAGGAARRLGLPTVTTVHGFIGGDWKIWLYERLQRRTFRRFSAVVAVSRPLGEELVADGVPRGRVHVVPNAYADDEGGLARDEARRRLSIPLDAFRIGWVGRLREEKGPDIMVEALAAADDPGLSLSMMGEGMESARLQALAARLGISDRIRWHGVVPNAGPLLAALDVFVLTSRREGTPMALFEAIAAGVPIVATRVGGVPDVLGPEEAMLVDADDAQAVARAIRAIRAEPAAARRRVEAARARLERDFGVEPWLTRYDEVYARARLQAHGEARR